MRFSLDVWDILTPFELIGFASLVLAFLIKGRTPQLRKIALGFWVAIGLMNVVALILTIH